MIKVNGQGQSGLPGITVEQMALLLIIMENGQKGSSKEEIRQKIEEKGIYFSDFKVSMHLKGLEVLGLLRSAVCQSTERWYSMLEVA